MGWGQNPPKRKGTYAMKNIITSKKTHKLSFRIKRRELQLEFDTDITRITPQLIERKPLDRIRNPVSYIDAIIFSLNLIILRTIPEKGIHTYQRFHRGNQTFTHL